MTNKAEKGYWLKTRRFQARGETFTCSLCKREVRCTRSTSIDGTKHSATYCDYDFCPRCGNPMDVIKGLSNIIEDYKYASLNRGRRKKEE